MHGNLQANLLGRVMFLWFTQNALALLVGYEILRSDVSVWYQYAPASIVLARFMCGIVLHVSLCGELKSGMLLMKYAVNHTWKFDMY